MTKHAVEVHNMMITCYLRGTKLYQALFSQHAEYKNKVGHVNKQFFISGILL